MPLLLQNQGRRAEKGRFITQGSLYNINILHLLKSILLYGNADGWKQKMFAENLSAIRRQKGYTQRQLAELSQLSVSSIEAYEEGKRLPLFGPMQRLCQALKVSPQELEQNWQQEIDPLERISEQIKQRLFAQ